MAKGKKNRHAGARRTRPPARDDPPTASAGVEASGAPISRGLLVAAVALLAVSGVVAWLAFGAGGDEREAQAPTDLAVPWIDPDGQDPVVGAVDVNPGDGSVWMSTNTGLFRVPEGGDRPERVDGRLATDRGTGEISEELVVRFTADDELIASGHPPAGSALPPALGLIRSRDAAKTWTSVSELGKADFHAIQVAGDVIVAGRYGEPAIEVSSDGGKSFEARRPPAPLVDLEVDPGNARRWVATTQAGIFTSSDQGATWRQRDPTPNARVSWPASGTLYRIDPGGPVKRSSDGGETWQDVGTTGGEPRALFAQSPRRLYAAFLDGTLKQSGDGGASWTDRVSPAGA